MKINGKEIKYKEFAYDGCHKIYLIDTPEEKAEAIEWGYEIKPIEELEFIYNNSCEFKFIYDWSTTETYAEQFEEAKFED